MWATAGAVVVGVIAAVVVPFFVTMFTSWREAQAKLQLQRLTATQEFIAALNDVSEFDNRPAGVAATDEEREALEVKVRAAAVRLTLLIRLREQPVREYVEQATKCTLPVLEVAGKLGPWAHGSNDMKVFTASPSKP